MPPTPPPALDVLGTLRLALAAWWEAFAPITLLGFLLLTLPSVATRAFFGDALGPGGDLAIETLVATLLGVARLLFLCAVSFGVMVMLAGHPVSISAFMRSGLKAAEPGLKVGLLLGAAALLLLGFAAVSRLLGPVAMLVAIGVALALLWGLAVMLPAVPAAIAERHNPTDALRRARELTRGQRGRLLGLCLIVALALLPAVGTISLIMFGLNATQGQSRRVLAELTLGDPRLWINELSRVLMLGLLATVPAAVYMELLRLRRP